MKSIIFIFLVSFFHKKRFYFSPSYIHYIFCLIKSSLEQRGFGLFFACLIKIHFYFGAFFIHFVLLRYKALFLYFCRLFLYFLYYFYIFNIFFIFFASFLYFFIIFMPVRKHALSHSNPI